MEEQRPRHENGQAASQCQPWGPNPDNLLNVFLCPAGTPVDFMWVHVGFPGPRSVEVWTTSHAGSHSSRRAQPRNTISFPSSEPECSFTRTPIGKCCSMKRACLFCPPPSPGGCSVTGSDLAPSSLLVSHCSPGVDRGLRLQTSMSQCASVDRDGGGPCSHLVWGDKEARRIRHFEVSVKRAELSNSQFTLNESFLLASQRLIPSRRIP